VNTATASRTSALISVKLSLQPDTSLHCKTRDTGQLSRDVLVYTYGFRWVLIPLTHGGMAQAE